MIAVQLCAVAIAGVLVALGVRATTRWPSATSSPLRRRRSAAAPVPAELERSEVLVGLAKNAGDLHLRVRPVLREIAGTRLAARGVALDGHDGRAQALLGDELWELVRPRRPRPAHSYDPGIEQAELARLVDRLESL